MKFAATLILALGLSSVQLAAAQTDDAPTIDFSNLGRVLERYAGNVNVQNLAKIGQQLLSEPQAAAVTQPVQKHKSGITPSPKPAPVVTSAVVPPPFTTRVVVPTTRPGKLKPEYDDFEQQQEPEQKPHTTECTTTPTYVPPPTTTPCEETTIIVPVTTNTIIPVVPTGVIPTYTKIIPTETITKSVRPVTTPIPTPSKTYTTAATLKPAPTKTPKGSSRVMVNGVGQIAAPGPLKLVTFVTALTYFLM